MRRSFDRSSIVSPAASSLGALVLTLAVAGVGAHDAQALAAKSTALCRGGTPAVAATHTDMHDGAWSYFGDPRSIARGNRVFTGCIGTKREVVVSQFDVDTGKSFHQHLRRNAELDDHDNPSLVLWKRRVWAFYSPHSGHVFPLNRQTAMRYRASRKAFDLSAGFGAERRVPTNTPGGLGYTYPNPVVARDKLWLFWRGGNWQPSFSYTKDGVTWAPARTLVRGPKDQRPYAKYVGGADGSIHMIFSEGHVQAYRTGLYYVRYKAGRFYRADGRQIGAMRDLPLRPGQTDRVYRFSAAGGRAWPHDIALDAHGRPVIVYTRRVGGPDSADTFFYARPDRDAWRSHRIVGAGRGAKTFRSGGITLDHTHPHRVVLSRTIGRWNEVEVWQTSDGGATWTASFPVTTGSDTHNIRPVIPRGFADPTRLLVFYVRGTAGSFRSFRSVIRMELGAPAAGSPAVATSADP